MEEGSDPFKVYYSTEKVAADSEKLGRRIFDNYRPDALFAIWRGGTAVAVHVSGVLDGYEAKHDSYSAAGKSYADIGKQSKGIAIYNMEELAKLWQSNGYKHLLGIDDISDTGRTAHAFFHIIRNGLRRKNAIRKDIRPSGHVDYFFEMEANQDKYILKVPLMGDIKSNDDAEIQFAMPYYKPTANKTGVVPDFWQELVPVDAKGTPAWVVFQWEASKDLPDREELKRAFPDVYSRLFG